MIPVWTSHEYCPRNEALNVLRCAYTRNTLSDDPGSALHAIPMWVRHTGAPSVAGAFCVMVQIQYVICLPVGRQVNVKCPQFCSPMTQYAFIGASSASLAHSRSTAEFTAQSCAEQSTRSGERPPHKGIRRPDVDPRSMPPRRREHSGHTQGLRGDILGRSPSTSERRVSAVLTMRVFAGQVRDR